MSLFTLKRLGTIMETEAGNEMEEEGVLNPAAMRGPDGHLYLFPRMVSKNNYSRIGIARVLFDTADNPVGVERLGVALEPTEEYEKRPNGGGGCEDPRVTYLEVLKIFVMTYCAYGPNGPRIAMARSNDLFKWERLGLISYLPFGNIDFNGVNNKDACLFPIDVRSPHDHPSIAILHRPLFSGTRPEELAEKTISEKDNRTREEIWISYCNLTYGDAKSYKDAQFTSHRRLAIPISSWEELKIGAGAPPILTKHGWLLVYHGVQELPASTTEHTALCYSAGVMILSENHPDQVIYRSLNPVLQPELAEEKVGVIANVIFPTGADRRDDIGKPERIDVYYGMADSRIGVATMIVPDEL